jgi:hypothetical protein
MKQLATTESLIFRFKGIMTVLGVENYGSIFARNLEKLLLSYRSRGTKATNNTSPTRKRGI